MKSTIVPPLWAALGLALSAGCATIAGLDEDYSVGSGAGGHNVGGSGNAAASGGAGATNTGSGVTGGSGATGGFGTGGDSCADGYECVPHPTGGTLALANAGGSCPADWSTPNQLVVGDDPGCTSCSSCNAPGGSCASINVQRYEEGTCSTPQGGPYSVTPEQCVGVDVSMSEQAQGYRVNIESLQSACPPTTPSSNPNPLAFTSVCELSASVQGSCAVAGVCIPEVTGTISGDVCVVVAGHEPCPAGYSQRSELHESFADNRTCGCGCALASSGSCSGTLNLWDDADCTGGPATFSTGGCNDASGNTGHDGFSVTGVAFTPGSCQTVADPGNVVFTDPVTLCCR